MSPMPTCQPNKYIHYILTQNTIIYLQIYIYPVRSHQPQISCTVVLQAKIELEKRKAQNWRWIRNIRQNTYSHTNWIYRRGGSKSWKKNQLFQNLRLPFRTSDKIYAVQSLDQKYSINFPYSKNIESKWMHSKPKQRFLRARVHAHSVIVRVRSKQILHRTQFIESYIYKIILTWLMLPWLLSQCGAYCTDAPSAHSHTHTHTPRYCIFQVKKCFLFFSLD